MRTRMSSSWRVALSVALVAGVLGMTVETLLEPPEVATMTPALREQVVLTIGADGRLFLGHREIARSDLVASLVSEMRRAAREDVVLRSHRSVNLGNAVDHLKAIDIAKARLWLQ
jgi:biopolymer transport protein ExbD